jgi:hypothetical protein
MAERKHTHGLSIREERGSRVLSLGQSGIWDAQDLSLLRDTLTQIILGEHCHAVGVDLHAVRFLPSGFFGTLFEWFDRGIAIRLYSPQPRVRNMLWFRQFFVAEREECFRLRDSVALNERNALELALNDGATD